MSQSHFATKCIHERCAASGHSLCRKSEKKRGMTDTANNRKNSVAFNLIELSIGRRIKALRTERGTRASDVAIWLGVTEEAYLDIESGGSRLRAAQVLVIAIRLGVPVGELFSDAAVHIQERLKQRR